MIKRIAFLLTVMMGAAHAQSGPLPIHENKTGNGAVIGAQVNPGPSYALRALANRFTSAVDIKDHGARCDGITNDTQAIQAALNAAANKARVLIPRGPQPCMISGVTLPGGTQLEIAGTVKLLPNSPPPGGSMLLIAAGASNISITGTGTVDGNASAQTRPAGYGGIGTPNASARNVYVSGLTITNCKNWPINFYAITNAFIEHAVMSQSGNTAGFAVGCTNCWADHVEVFGIQDHGFGVYGGGTTVGIVNSHIHHNRELGLIVLNDQDQPAPARNILLSNNTVTDNGRSGIAVWSAKVEGAPNQYVTIANNITDHNNRLNGPYHGGIWVPTGKHILITGNRVSHDGNGGNPSAGIYLGSLAEDVKLSNNEVFDIGQGGANSTGVRLDNPVSADISCNRIYDNQTPKTMLTGIGGACGPGCVIRGNTLGNFINVRVGVKLLADAIVDLQPSPACPVH